MAWFQTDVGPMVAQFRPTMGRAEPMDGNVGEGETAITYMTRHRICAAEKEAADAAADVKKTRGNATTAP